MIGENYLAYNNVYLKRATVHFYWDKCLYKCVNSKAFLWSRYEWVNTKTLMIMLNHIHI